MDINNIANFAATTQIDLGRFTEDDGTEVLLEDRNNCDQARSAAAAVLAYWIDTEGAYNTGNCETHGSCEELLSDFLCDFMHLARLHDLDMDTLLSRAAMHHDAERDGAV